MENYFEVLSCFEAQKVTDANFMPVDEVETYTRFMKNQELKVCEQFKVVIYQKFFTKSVHC